MTLRVMPDGLAESVAVGALTARLAVVPPAALGVEELGGSGVGAADSRTAPASSCLLSGGRR
jgi:hypothetical protein